MSDNTKNKFSFQIEGELFSSSENILTAKDIIEKGKEKGLIDSTSSIENLILKGQKNSYSAKEPVDLSKDHVFSLEFKKIYKFKVNGQEMESEFEKLIALDIIDTAKKNGVSLPGKAENLLLETVGDKQYRFKLDEWVNLNQCYEFLLILNEPTPVA